MDTAPTILLRWFARWLVVVACTTSSFVAAAPSLGAAPPHHSPQAPICGDNGREQICIAGWSTGITFRYSGDANLGSAVQNGGAFVGQVIGGSELNVLNMQLSWQGAGTYYLPLPAGRWDVEATGTQAAGALIVGPGEPPPPTTCSTVSQGTAATSVDQPQPWVSGIAATMNGTCPGYWITSPSGAVNSVGGAALLGGGNGSNGGISAGGVTPPINGTIVGVARTPDSNGYWLASSDGGVFAFGPGYFSTGDAGFYGSMGGRALNRPVVGITATPDGRGYWLVASDGGVFAFGDAAFYGSTGGMHLNRPIVGITATVDGKGYWLVASDGGVFAFGDATFRGSMGAAPVHRPIVAVAADPEGSGYWLVASDGGVFAFGAPFLGSLGGASLSAPIVGITPSPEGEGYSLLGADSTVYAFGDARYLGVPLQPG